MKTRIASLLLVFLALSAFRTDDPATLLQRKWKLAPESVPTYFEALVEAVRAQAPDQAGQMEANRVMIEAMVSNVTFDYQKDGVFVVTGAQGAQTGTWKLSEDGKKLTLGLAGQTGDSEIKSLGADKLVMRDGQLNVELTYVPAE